MRRRTLLLALVLSAGAHVFFLRYTRFKESPVIAPLPVVVWHEEPKPPPKPQKRAHGQHGQSGKRGGSPLSQLNLHSLGIETKAESLAGDLAVAGGGDPRGSTGSAILDRMRDTAIDASLYERIESAFFYPEELADKGIGGTVRAIVVFDADGIYRRDKSVLRTESPYLRVVVARLLREVFVEPLASVYLRGRARKQIFCRFEFQLVGDLSRHQAPVDPVAMREGVVDENMTFHRMHRPAMVWKKGPFIFTPFAMAIDVEEAPKDVAALFERNKAKADPLEPYRRDPEWHAGS